MKITALLVDDEAIAREVLRNYLTKYCPQVTILGEAENIKQAVPFIEENQPQLVFLDVEMPYGNAFDILEATQEYKYETIFITAFSEYSLKALNRSAAYYILKPIDIEELVTAVQKVVNTIEKEEQINRNQFLLNNLKQIPERQQILLPTQTGFDVIKLNEIIRIQADGNFTQVYLENGTKKMVCRVLKHFEDILEKPFIRVHRSHIINLNYVKSYTKGSGGYLTMTDDMEIEVSQAYKKVLLEAF